MGALGGYAYIIKGTVDPRRFQPLPVKRTLLDRILGRTRTNEPKVSELKNGSKFFDIRCDDLKPIAEAFKTFLKGKLPKPWPATKSIFGYLDLSTCRIYVRANQDTEGGPRNSYVQISFMGCSGMAQTTSEVCAHWAEIWWKEKKQLIIEQYFNPFGFVPADDQDAETFMFLPLNLGYARFVGEKKTRSEFPESRFFDVDDSLRETLDDKAGMAFRQLDDRFAELFSDGRCRCQFCAPEFDATTVEGLLL